MQTSRKKDAPRLARPAARYWKGKVPKGVAEAQDSDSDYDEETQEQQAEDVPIGDISADEGEEDELVVQEQKTEIKKSMNVALRNVNISTEGKVVVDGREESGRTIMEQEGISSSFILTLYHANCVVDSEEEESEEEEAKAGKEGGTDVSYFVLGPIS